MYNPAVPSPLSSFLPTTITPLTTQLKMPRSPRAASATNQNLTNAQKQQIQAHYNAHKDLHPSYPFKDLADWTQQTFNLSYAPSRSTLHRILKQDNSPGQYSPTCKKKVPTRSEELDRLLAQWVVDQQARHVMINGHLIRQQGEILQARINNTHSSADQKLALKFSNGWLEKFCQRHGFRQKIAHGESGSIQQSILDKEIPAIKEVLQQHHPDDIFNADETGLFYNMPPQKTIGSAAVSGLKKNKIRMTILFGCNSSGTEKLEPFFIGSSKQPRAFQNLTPEQLGFQYSANKKAWMTWSLFSEWLASLDSHVGKTPGRHILLLLDNCSAHKEPKQPAEEPIQPLELQNITIHFLPPNSTSRIQPLDAGIIAAFKKQYRAKQYQQALLQAELGSSEDIYKLDILEAMVISKEIWENLDPVIIRNCWRHTGLLESQEEEPEASTADSQMDKEVEEIVRKLTEVSLVDVVQPDGEEDVMAGSDDLEDISEAPSSPLTPKMPVEHPQTLEGQQGILRAAQEIMARYGLLDQHVLEVFEACSICLDHK